MQLDRRLLSFLKSRYLLLSLPIAAGFLGGVLVVFQARILSSIVNSVFIHHETLAAISRWLAILLLLIVIRGGMIWGGNFTASRLAIKIKTDLRSKLFDHLNLLGPSYLKPGSKSESNPTGELIQVINQG
ncbi:MAG: hypothetical protein KAT29_08795, partial [Anaerolineales bacterium]|nr:hypothetical protein [Anaerolineales bacterium]